MDIKKIDRARFDTLWNNFDNGVPSTCPVCGGGTASDRLPMVDPDLRWIAFQTCGCVVGPEADDAAGRPA